MPWREDFSDAGWIDPGFGLSGWPDPKDGAAQRSDPIEAVVFVRDRIGFRYERIVGLNDYVSQREAAQLLGLPVMTVNRWVRSKKLPSTKRNGFSVIQLRHVLEVAKTEGCEMKMMGKLHIQHEDSIEREWIDTGTSRYETDDEA